jgi:hypothetical protein
MRRPDSHGRGSLSGGQLQIRDRCYDFVNIFAKKIAKKLAFLTRNKAKLCKFEHSTA